MLQIFLTLAIYIVLVIPVGIYMYHLTTNQKTFADPIFNKADNFIYSICKIDRTGMNWKRYALSFITTNAVMVLIGYLILRFQGSLMLNPNNIGGMESTLSFNTIISFMTNTNLQHYSGESGLSYLSQIMVIIFMMFTSAASGFSVFMAFSRGISGRGNNLGNFYEDMIRVTTRILIPIAFIVAILLVSQGVPQTLNANITVTTIEGKLQDIALGPVAALESIKQLGTNGGGFFGANSAAPFENPTVISNIIEMIAMMLMPGACVIVFGKMVADKKAKNQEKTIFGKQGAVIFIAMSIIFIIGLLVCFYAEKTGNPILAKIGLNQNMGNMEGKEARFGIAQSALFTTVTTSFTTGAVNNALDSLTPLGGMVPLLHMMLNSVFGGKGVGFMNMIMYVILSVFLCGLMIGRTPEYLGKKIEAKEMKLAVLVLIIHPLLILGFSALAVAVPAGLDGITNHGFHGLSQVLYEFTSSAANNGSGFEGLADNTVFWNITTGLVMFFGRYLAIIMQLAIASSLMSKTTVNQTIGSLRTDNATFTIALVFVVYIFAALTFFPALSLGPIAEHLALWF